MNHRKSMNFLYRFIILVAVVTGFTAGRALAWPVHKITSQAYCELFEPGIYEMIHKTRVHTYSLVNLSSDANIHSFKIHVAEVLINAVLWHGWKFHLLIIACFVTICGAGFSIYRAWRTRALCQKIDNERLIAELKFEIFRNQLASHFLFNTLNAIGSSIYQNDKEKSYDFLQRFSTHIRLVLVNADRMYRKLNEEIEFVRNYLDFEQFRFENKFDYRIELEEGIDVNMPVPKMIIQTFAENAVNHGLVPRTGKGLLSIHLRAEKEYCEILIEDNGIDQAEMKNSDLGISGKGIEIMKDTIDFYNTLNENKIQIETVNLREISEESRGTRVIIKLPIDFNYNSITQPHESI